MGVRFRVYGCERMRRQRLIGEAAVQFSSLRLELENSLWLSLQPRANIQVSLPPFEWYIWSFSGSNFEYVSFCTDDWFDVWFSQFGKIRQRQFLFEYATWRRSWDVNWIGIQWHNWELGRRSIYHINFVWILKYFINVSKLF